MPRAKKQVRERQEEDILLDEILPDPLMVQNQQPGFRYRLFRRDATRLAVAQSTGYIPVKKGDPEALVGDVGGNPEAVQQFADTILHRIPEDLARKRDKAKALRIQRLNRQAATSVFEAEAGRGARVEGEVEISGPFGRYVDRQRQGGEAREDA